MEQILFLIFFSFFMNPQSSIKLLSVLLFTTLKKSVGGKRQLETFNWWL